MLRRRRGGASIQYRRYKYFCTDEECLQQQLLLYSTVQYRFNIIIIIIQVGVEEECGSEIRETEGRNTLITNCCSVVLLYIFTINMYEETYTLYTARHQTEEAGEWNRK